MFKVGDVIIRVQDPAGVLPVGHIDTVVKINKGILRLAGHPNKRFKPEYFKRYSGQYSYIAKKFKNKLMRV